MAVVVILGAGLGGVPVAYELREQLAVHDTIILVNDRDLYHFVPSNPWIVVGWRRPENISVNLREPLTQKGIVFITSKVTRIDPHMQRVSFEHHPPLQYDQLVISTGTEPAFDEVSGTGPDHHSHSIVHIDHAIQARTAWEQFVDHPGDIVVGAVQSASCFGPAYEFAFILDRDLRERHIRDQATLTFITPEPYIGHLGYGGIGDSRRALESRLTDAGIRWYCNASVRKAWSHYVDIDVHGPQGEVVAQHSLHSTFTMLIPAFRGIDALRDIPGLVDSHGFVIVDEHLRNTHYPTVWSLGAAVAIPDTQTTPVPVHVPKAGFMIESMVSAVAANIRAVLAGQTPTHTATWNAIYLADMGNTGIAFIALPQIPPRRREGLAHGVLVHQAKVAFERYFLDKIRRGSKEHIYEDYVLKTLGQDKNADP